MTCCTTAVKGEALRAPVPLGSSTSDIQTLTIPVGIANFQELYHVPWGDLAAASVVAAMPLVPLVQVFQRQIVAGPTQGVVKE